MKIIKEFEKIDKLPYEKNRTKYEPTDRYFHLARQLSKFMMRSDNLNWYDHGSYTEMIAPKSLRKLGNYLIRRRGPKTSLLTATFF